MTVLCPKTTETKPVSLYMVLRDAGLDMLKARSTDELKAYMVVLDGRISHVNTTLSTTNQFKSDVAQLREDLRWYEKVKVEICQLLTKEFHCK